MATIELTHSTRGMEFRGVRKDMTGIPQPQREESEALARMYIARGMRPPQLTVKNNGVDVSEEAWNWPPTERDYRGPGRLTSTVEADGDQAGG